MRCFFYHYFYSLHLARDPDRYYEVHTPYVRVRFRSGVRAERHVTSSPLHSAQASQEDTMSAKGITKKDKGKNNKS